jgi:hypothetical protein
MKPKKKNFFFLLYNDEKASASLKQLLQNEKNHTHTEKFPFYFGEEKEKQKGNKVDVLFKSYTSR